MADMATSFSQDLHSHQQSSASDSCQPTVSVNHLPVAGPSCAGMTGTVPCLPDELLEAILITFTRSFPPHKVIGTLASCSRLSRHWYRLVTPLLYVCPVIKMGSKKGARHFITKLADELIEYELELMDSVKRQPRSNSLIDQMRRIMFVGEARWRHRASFESRSRPEVVDRATLHEIFNRLWCTRIESLVFIELPFVNPFHRPIVNRLPATLTTLILLTPLSPFELLFALRDLPTLNHLCIGSRDDSSSTPAEHHTLFSRDQLPSSNLRSFGICARTLEGWYKTGLPWNVSMLNLLVVPSVRSVTTLHLEFADEDDERHLMAILGNPPPALDPPDPNVALQASRASTEKLFKLETVYLRGLSSVLMAESLSRLEGIRKLCLSSVYGTALRCPTPATVPTVECRTFPIVEPTAPNADVQSAIDAPERLSITVGRARRTISHRNPVWHSIPSTIEELSIDITRPTGQGPWNQRSSGHLARTLAELINSCLYPKLRILGSIFAEPGFEFGIYGPHREISPLSDLVEAAASHGVRLVPSLWNDSFVSNYQGTSWF